jgi:putative addiction module killer protein
MEVRPKQLEIYEAQNGVRPFEKFMERIEGQKIHGIVLNRLDRVKRGLLGDWGAVGQGVAELIFDVGPGYRIYFGQDADKIILLGGGMKRTQSKDILVAKRNWSDYNA